MAQDGLEASVAAGQAGPVITLSGETDLFSVARLIELIRGPLPGVMLELTIDVSGLRFADTASIQALLLAAGTMRERGGHLVLLHPQPPVAKALALLDADQMFTIQGGTAGEPGYA